MDILLQVFIFENLKRSAVISLNMVFFIEKGALSGQSKITKDLSKISPMIQIRGVSNRYFLISPQNYILWVLI